MNFGTPNGGKGPDGTPHEIRARKDHIAVGIQGRSGSEIDRISLITARPEIVRT